MRSKKKRADIRIVLEPDVAEKLRERAAIGHRSIQAQAALEIERGIAYVEEKPLGAGTA